MDKKLPEFDPASMFATTVSERRAAMQRIAEERAIARRRDLDSQTSPGADAQERIRIWERLHALNLPDSATHPLLAVIATDTDLSVHAVKDEQVRRRALSRPATQSV